MTNDKLTAMRSLRDALTEAITAIEAGREAEVEYNTQSSGNWQPVDFGQRDYRVAVKPREAFAVTWPNGSYYSIHDTRAGAERLVKERGDSCFEIIRLVEEP